MGAACSAAVPVVESQSVPEASSAAPAIPLAAIKDPATGGRIIARRYLKTEATWEYLVEPTEGGSSAWHDEFSITTTAAGRGLVEHFRGAETETVKFGRFGVSYSMVVTLRGAMRRMTSSVSSLAKLRTSTSNPQSGRSTFSRSTFSTPRERLCASGLTTHARTRFCLAWRLMLSCHGAQRHERGKPLDADAEQQVPQRRERAQTGRPRELFARGRARGQGGGHDQNMILGRAHGHATAMRAPRALQFRYYDSRDSSENAAAEHRRGRRAVRARAHSF